MKIQELYLRNFRRYEKARFRFHPRFTILIGENGKGKTSILDALSIMLGSYFIGSGIKIGQSTITKTDKRLISFDKNGQLFAEPQKDVFLSALGRFRGQPLEWRRDPLDRGGQARPIMDIGESDRDAVSQGADVVLPLLLYYGAGRLWDIHRDINTAKSGSRLDGYRFCLDPKSDHKAFQKWFKLLTVPSKTRPADPIALDAVKNAVVSCVPNCDDFFFDIREDDMVLRFKNGSFEFFNNLSDGYRNMVAMVADIAHRAARLNPHQGSDAARLAIGVVLIDEIDLHLHPKWQRQVVNDLQQAFPNIQFIATTHSPFIIQSSVSGEVIDLNREPVEVLPEGIDVAYPGPTATYENKPIEEIAEEIMGIEVPSRSAKYQRMFDTAKRYYELLELSKTAIAAPELDRIKTELDQLSSPFSDNVAYYAFLEMERVAAGLGSGSQV